MSKLYFRYGAMNCGKSTALMQVAHNYEERGMFVKVIKPSIDLKAEDKISSRIGIERKADFLISDVKSLREYLNNISKENISCVLVDEAQFLTREEVDELFVFCKLTNIPVICYGLRTDFKANAFPGSERLFEVSDELEELTTICDCGKKAKFNARVINGEFTLVGDQVAIDGIDASYVSLCGKCYLSKVLKIERKND